MLALSRKKTPQIPPLYSKIIASRLRFRHSFQRGSLSESFSTSLGTYPSAFDFGRNVHDARREAFCLLAALATSRRITREGLFHGKIVQHGRQSLTTLQIECVLALIQRLRWFDLILAWCTQGFLCLNLMCDGYTFARPCSSHGSKLDLAPVASNIENYEKKITC